MSDEHVYEMGLYLHLLANGCFPKWPEVFSLAERVIETLRIADEELLLHLQTIAKVQPNIDPKVGQWLYLASALYGHIWEQSAPYELN